MMKRLLVDIGILLALAVAVFIGYVTYKLIVFNFGIAYLLARTGQHVYSCAIAILLVGACVIVVGKEAYMLITEFFPLLADVWHDNHPEECMMKRLLQDIGILLAVAVAVVGGYVAYVFIAYYRLPDNLALEVQGEASGENLQVGQPYSIVTWNLGFGAYSADYGFFMDGGTESRAYSKEAVYENLGRAIEVLQGEDADLLLLQELDTDATRSYHVDETALVASSFEDMSRVFAQNYDSPYLFYPLTKPHGATKAGMLTLSKAGITSALRRSLPVETGFMKFLDLDRCYSVCRIPVADGRELCLYNLHLSAYTSDGTIATEQLYLLTADMAEECAKGNYVIAGGDFNKDLLGNSGEVFGVSTEGNTWAQPIDVKAITEGLTLVSSLDPDNPVPSCRSASGPYVADEYYILTDYGSHVVGKTLVLTIDGFIVSDNVSVVECHVIDEAFAVSDHNPVKMTFELKEDNNT